jgi:hypothetical protein
MDLRESKFYYAGDDLNFAVFSDHPCHVRYLESIPLPMSQSPVSVYSIEPAVNSRWVVVQEKHEEASRQRLFVRSGATFLEDHSRRLPESVRKQLQQRIPKGGQSSQHFRRLASPH